MAAMIDPTVIIPRENLSPPYAAAFDRPFNLDVALSAVFGRQAGEDAKRLAPCQQMPWLKPE